MRIGTALIALTIAASLGDHATAHAEWLTTSRLPISYRTWTIESDSLETTVSQLHAPVVTSFRFSDQVDLVLSTAYASSGTETKLSGLDTFDADLASVTDLKAQIFWRLPGDRVLLQAGTNAPSGAHSLELEELAVVQSLSHPILGFRLKHYGEGWNTSAGIAAAFPVGETVRLGIGAGFVHRGAYEFVSDTPDFQPGSEVSVSAGLDIVDEEDHPWFRIDTTYRTVQADQLDGDDVYEEGDQIEVDATLASAPRAWQGRLAGRVVSKRDDSVLAPVGNTVSAIKLAAGSSTRISGELLRRTAGGLAFGPSVQWSRFSGADRVADGSAFGGGPTLEIPLGNQARVSAHAFYLTGTIDGTTELDLSGLEAGLAFAWLSGW